MIVTLPKLGPVKFRDDLTQEQFLAQVDQLSKKHGFKMPGPDYGLLGSFTKGVSRGASRLGSTFGDVIPAIGASALGFDEYAERQMAEAKASQEKLDRTNPAQFDSYKQVEGFGDAARFALETLGETTPDILAAVASGGVGSSIAKRGATKLAERELAAITPGLVETGASAQELAQVTSRVGAEALAKKQAQGQGIGVYLGSYALNTPEVFQSIYADSNQLAPGASLLFGSVSAALDSVLPATLLRSMSPAFKAKVTEKVLQQSGMRPGLAKNVTIGALKGVSTEALTEASQEAINIAAEGFVNKNRKMWTSEDFNRIVESGVRGAVAGGAFGAVGGVGTNAQQRSAQQEIQQREEDARMAEEQRLADIEQQRQQAIALQEEQALRRSQANMPMGLPGFEDAVGPVLSQTEPLAAPEVVPEGQQDLFGATGRPTPEALASVRAGPIAAARAEKDANVTQKQAMEELAPKSFDIMQNVRMQDSGLGVSSPLQSLINQAQEFGPKVKPAKVAEPTTPAVPTPPPAPSNIITDDTLKGLGIGHSGILRRDKVLDGLDITKPEDATRVRQVFDTYLDNKNLSPTIRKNVDAFLETLPAAEVTTEPTQATPVTPLETTQAQEALQAQEANKLVPIEDTWDNFDTGIDFKDMPITLQEEITSLRNRNELNQEEADSLAEEVKTKKPAPAVEEVTPVEVNTGERNSPFSGAIAADYLLTGGSGVMKSTEFLAQAYSGLFKKSSAAIEEIRKKYTPEIRRLGLDSIKDFAASPLYKQMLAEIQAVVEVDHNNHPDIASIFNEVAKYPSGMPPKVGAKLSNQIEAVEAAPTPKPAPAPKAVAAPKPAAAPAAKAAPAPKAAKKVKAKKITKAEVDSSTDAKEAMLTAIKAELNPNDLSRINTYYDTQDSNTALDKFTEDFIDWVFSGAKNTQHKLINLFNKMLLAARNGVLSVAMLVNLNPANTPINFIEIPVNTFTVQETVERPKVDFKDITAPASVQMVANQQFNTYKDSPIIVVDKEAGLSYVFDSKGVIAGKSASLTGSAKGDFKSERAKKVKLSEMVTEDKVTEAGEFTGSREVSKHYGSVIRIASYDNYFTAMHRTFLERPAEQRQARIDSPTSEDNRITSSCINVPQEFFEDVIAKVVPMNGKVQVVVMPETTDVESFFPDADFATSDTTYTTKTVRGNVASTPDKKTSKITAGREELTREQALANLGAALSAKFEQKLNLVPGETAPDLLKAISQMIEVLIRDGARSLGEVTLALRRDLGENNFRRVNKKDVTRIYNEKKPKGTKEKVTPANNPITEQANEVGTVDSVLDSLPEPKDTLLNSAANALSNVPDGLRKGAFGFLSLPNMVELFGKTFPTLQNLLVAVEKRGSRNIEYRDEVSRVVREGSQIVKSLSPEMVKKFNNITLDLTRLKLDPRADKDKNHPVVKQFYALPKPVYTYALKLADKYKEYGDKYLELMINAIPQKAGREYLTLVEKMKAQFESNRIPFYLPLQRSGEYWVSFQDKNGERVVLARESQREAEQLVGAISKLGGTNIQRYSKLSQITRRSVPPTGFMAEVVRDLNTAGVSDEVINGIYQSYLSLFPAESLKQQFRPREGVLGYDNDVVQGFANIGSRMAHQLANMEYSTDIGNALKGVREVFEANPTMYNRDIMENITAQEEFLANPVAAPWASRTSYFSYLSFITGNVSSAVVNLTQLPIVVYSMLGGKYGFGQAASAMSRATKMYFAGSKDNNSEFMPDWTFGVKAKGEYAELYKQAVDRSALRRGVGYDLTEMGKSRTEDYTGLKSKIEHGLGFMFQNSERFNREVTLIAAFDLARKSGKSVQEAIDEAIKLNTDAHSHALADAGPRWFQNNFGKVMFTFKRFAQAQIYLTSRLAHQAFAGESPEVRRVAQKQLMGIFGMAYLFAGAQGMPLYGAANLLASALNAALGDDDELFDFDESVREAIGDMGYKGPVNQILNADIAGRTGFNGMIFRDDPRRLAEVGPLVYAIERFAGPAYSVFIVNPSRAMDQLKNGQVERSIETMMPSFIRNGMKGVRFATEGALNSKGIPIVDDVNDYNALMQVLGFTPAGLSEAYARAGVMKEADKFTDNRKKALLDALYLARTNGDFEGLADINEKIAAFNIVHPEPGTRITQDTIKRSKTTRENALKNSVDGVYINPKRKNYLVENYGS